MLKAYYRIKRQFTYKTYRSYNVELVEAKCVPGVKLSACGTPASANVSCLIKSRFVYVNDALASSKVKWKFAGVNHGFTEPHAVVAHWDPNGRLQLFTPQQVPHYLHRALADVLEIPMHQINVIRTFVGGGFGGKSDPFPHEMCFKMVHFSVRILPSSRKTIGDLA